MRTSTVRSIQLPSRKEGGKGSISVVEPVVERFLVVVVVVVVVVVFARIFSETNIGLGLKRKPWPDRLREQMSQTRTNHSTVFGYVDTLPRISRQLTANRRVVPPQK